MQEQCSFPLLYPSQPGPSRGPVPPSRDTAANEWLLLPHFSLYTEDSTPWLPFWALFFPSSPSPPLPIPCSPFLPFLSSFILYFFSSPSPQLKTFLELIPYQYIKSFFKFYIVILKSIVQIYPNLFKPYPLFMSTYVVLRIFQSLATANNAGMNNAALTMNLSLLVEGKDRHS